MRLHLIPLPIQFMLKYECTLTSCTEGGTEPCPYTFGGFQPMCPSYCNRYVQLQLRHTAQGASTQALTLPLKHPPPLSKYSTAMCMYACLHAWIYAWVLAWVHTHTHTCVYVRAGVHACMRACVHVCIPGRAGGRAFARGCFEDKNRYSRSFLTRAKYINYHLLVVARW